jgi:CRISPR-associated protein Csm1
VDNPAENMTICTTCRELIGLGSQLIADRNAAADDKLQFVVTSVLPGSGSLKMPLPALDGEAWLTLQTTRQLRETLRNAPERVIRIYSKNHRSAGLEVSTRLWVGDYNFCAINQGGAVEFKDFVDMRGDEGIGRIAVLRADVDNLGSLFSGGFRGDNPDKSRYETLGRYATLSRSLSRFLKTRSIRSHQRNSAIWFWSMPAETIFSLLAPGMK